MLPISSLQNPTIKLIRSLEHKKERRDAGLFVAEGFTMLERAEALGWVPETVLATKHVDVFDEVKPTIVTDKIMAELSGQNNPHDVLAVFKQRYQPHPSKEGLWLALEEVRDPGNMGTIIRTADAVDVKGIILVGDCCDPYSPECVRASTGSIFGVTLVRMNLAGMLDFAKAWPGDMVGTSGTARSDFRKEYLHPVLLAMGSESRGLSAELSRSCTQQVRIPMKDGVESLNVATAAALMLYQMSDSIK